MEHPSEDCVLGQKTREFLVTVALRDYARWWWWWLWKQLQWTIVEKEESRVLRNGEFQKDGEILSVDEDKEGKSVLICHN